MFLKRLAVHFGGIAATTPARAALKEGNLEKIACSGCAYIRLNGVSFPGGVDAPNGLRLPEHLEGVRAHWAAQSGWQHKRYIIWITASYYTNRWFDTAGAWMAQTDEEQSVLAAFLEATSAVQRKHSNAKEAEETRFECERQHTGAVKVVFRFRGELKTLMWVPPDPACWRKWVAGQDAEGRLTFAPTGELKRTILDVQASRGWWKSPHTPAADCSQEILQAAVDAAEAYMLGEGQDIPPYVHYVSARDRWERAQDNAYWAERPSNR